MPRLFVALDLPDAERRRLAALRDSALSARWTPEHQHHLTLRFIGDVPEAEVASIQAALAAVHAAPVKVEGMGLGVFPSQRNPRVLFARVHEDPGLMRLQGHTETVLTNQGLPPDERPFHPHITLARLKRADARRVRRYRKRHADFQIGPLTIRAFTLYASLLGPDGARHEPLASYPLGDT